MAKVFGSLWIAIPLWFVIPVPDTLPTSSVALAAALGTELMIGFFLGFLGRLVLLAIQSAGEMMDVQMGLSVANVLDPSLGVQISIIGRLLFLAGMFFFLSLNGHHVLLSALYRSFEVIPVSTIPTLHAQSGAFLGTLGQTLWQVALQLAIPALVMLLMVDFGFGIVSRVAPQVNVFMLGFQIKPTVGIIAVFFMLPFFAPYLQNTLLTMSELLAQGLKLLSVP